ncbi:2OG-Fe(II) oxygenase [Woodsholea maritima]|uniref:2OG-Fe(II) oxygenase n=1 Tax=Woodsholea maritima TaxID=240237 RepID=UPI00037E288A|nr:2OG-Fe(II) oxygenase family protein [Woodsholea maritima]
MSTVELRLNPDLDVAHFKAIYQRDGLVQIPDILPFETANALHEVLSKSIPWKMVFAESSPQQGTPDRITQLSNDDIQAMGQAAFGQKMNTVMAMARNNLGFLYHSYPMIQAAIEGWDPGHPIHHLTQFLNSREFLDFGCAVIGAETITKADAQATLYAPNNFLTRHVDDGFNKERRAAYTFGFTPHWEPDWGGLLMFLDKDKNIRQGYLPRFNTLTLFDGLRIHSVSCVSPFAGAGRYQITGWLRDDPIPGRG